VEEQQKLNLIVLIIICSLIISVTHTEMMLLFSNSVRNVFNVNYDFDYDYVVKNNAIWFILFHYIINIKNVCEIIISNQPSINVHFTRHYNNIIYLLGILHVFVCVRLRFETKYIHCLNRQQSKNPLHFILKICNIWVFNHLNLVAFFNSD